jgi:CRP/FNR family cyclic AMP-dependent transcriptional regulator
MQKQIKGTPRLMPQINIFDHATTFEPYKAGEEIFSANDVGNTMYVVLEGELDILINDKVVETASVGSIIGELALIEPDHRRSATVVAKTDCKLVSVDEKRFKFLVQQTPFFALEVMQVMADRLRRWSFAG